MELWLILFLAGLGLVGLELVLPMMFWMPLGLAAIATAPVSYFVDHWSVLGIWPILSMVLFIGILHINLKHRHVYILLYISGDVTPTTMHELAWNAFQCNTVLVLHSEAVIVNVIPFWYYTRKQ